MLEVEKNMETQSINEYFIKNKMEYAEPPRAPPISYDFDSSGPPQTAFFGADGM